MGWLKPEGVGKFAWRAGRKQEADNGVVATLRHPVQGLEGVKIQEEDVISGIPEVVGEAIVTRSQRIDVLLDLEAMIGKAVVADIHLRPTDRGVPDVQGIMIHRDNPDHLSQDRPGVTETAAALDEESVRGTMTGADRTHAADAVRQRRRAPELGQSMATRKDGKKLKANCSKSSVGRRIGSRSGRGNIGEARRPRNCATT